MKKLAKVIIIIEALFVLWLAGSWIDIVADNCNENPQHWKYNAFVMLVENSKPTGVDN